MRALSAQYFPHAFISAYNRVLKRLLELVDPQFAEALERYAPFLPI